MINLIHRLWQNFYYGYMRNVSDVDLSDVPMNITLKSHYDKRNKVYWVESDQLPDFEATGKTLEELATNIGDALLVYLDIPYYFAKNYEDGILTIKDPRTKNGEVIRVSRTGVERVLNPA